MIKLGKVGMVCMEWYQQKWAHHLPIVLVKKILFCVQECVKITEEGN